MYTYLHIHIIIYVYICVTSRAQHGTRRPDVRRGQSASEAFANWETLTLMFLDICIYIYIYI